LKTAIKQTSFVSLFVLILMLIPAQASITGAIDGTIKDSATGQFLEGAKITIVSAKSETMSYALFTDKKGHFYKGGLVTGSYKVTVEKEGYLPQEGTVRVNIDETTRFDIPLAPAQNAAPASISASRMILSGSELMSAGKYEEAIAKFNEVIVQAPTNPVAYFYRAAAYEKTGQTDGALEDYKKAIELKPDFILCYGRSGIILAKKGEFEKAAEFYKKAVELGDQDPATHYNYGVCLVNLGKSAEARGVFENVITLDANYADAYYQLGIISIGAGDSAKTKELLERFIALDPENNNASIAKEILKSLK
jgi:tetratricopeptide (TPR) repeat protein